MRSSSSGAPASVQTASASAMWIVAVAVVVIYLLSTIPTPLYVMYRSSFGFSEIMLTLIFAVYVAGTLAAMFFLGKLSDQIGRRPVVLAALAISAVSAVIFLLARSTVWLFPARALSGLAIALATGASTAWIVELEPRHDKPKATRAAINANLLGLAGGCLLAGLLAQFAPWPLHLSYILFLLLLAPIAWLVYRQRETVEPDPGEKISLRPRLGVPREIRGRFISPAVAAFAIFAVMGFYTALIPSLLTRTFHNHNHAAAGAIVAELFIIGALAVTCTPQLKIIRGLILSLLLLLPGVGLLMAAEAIHSLALLLAATALGGVATCLGYQYGLEAINEMSPEDKRSEIVSTYLIFCYAGVSIPVIGIGFLARLTGPFVADCVFAGVIALMAIAALVAALRGKQH